LYISVSTVLAGSDEQITGVTQLAVHGSGTRDQEGRIGPRLKQTGEIPILAKFESRVRKWLLSEDER
jgi:hypothetical protein